jgi:uncharacterized protein (TIGR00106 family)
MQATVELQVIPLGRGASVRNEIKQVIDLLNGYSFILETHASGTNIEGELSEIFAAIEKVHKHLHGQGSVRLLSYIKVETRIDKVPTLAGKRLQA